MIKEDFYFTPKNGRIGSSITRNKIMSLLFTLEDKKCKLTIERLSSKRSNPQNSYLHVLIGIFCKGINELGTEMHPKRWKEILKFKFLLTDEVDESTGEVLGKYIKDTSALNKEELSVFIEKIKFYAADEYHIVLPDAGDNYELNFN